jgi:hypothetical protein
MSNAHHYKNYHERLAAIDDTQPCIPLICTQIVRFVLVGNFPKRSFVPIYSTLMKRYLMKARIIKAG